MSFIVPSDLPEPPPAYDYTQKELDFCILYALGSTASNGTESVKAANYTVANDNVAGVTAHRLLSNNKITDYISILKQHSLSPQLLNREKKLELLSKFAYETHYTVGGNLTRAQNMSAIDLHNKMTGEYDLSLKDILGALVFDVEFVKMGEGDDTLELTE